MSNSRDAELQLIGFIENSFGRDLSDLSEEEITGLVLAFAIWPDVDSYIKAPWLARYAVRRQRHRTDERSPSEKRDLWGMPDEKGYFADDNSLLKSTFKNSRISGPKNPYKTSTLSTGLVCCHIWPATTSDPLLFSFIPNLVWLPKSLARFTDVYNGKDAHRAHYVLQELSHSRYRHLNVEIAAEDCQLAWNKLKRPTENLPGAIQYTKMDSEPKLSARVRTRHLRLTAFLEAAISEPVVDQKRFSRRYHLGFGGLIDKTIPPVNRLVSREHLVELKRIVTESTPL